jgi:predicted RNA-binding Zn ribbon-like protein
MTNFSGQRRPPRFDLTGGALCLDFVNTLDNRPSEEPTELLESYVDLAHFGDDTGIVKPEQADGLVKRSHAAPEEAQRVLRNAIELREALYAIFSAVLRKHTVPATALAKLNKYVQEAGRHSHLIESKRRFELRFDQAGPEFEAILWPIARSAAELLASEQLPFVRACSSPSCQWLFLDTSKNHRRRWCSMKLCGNRTKVRRFYARRRTQR